MSLILTHCADSLIFTFITILEKDKDLRKVLYIVLAVLFVFMILYNTLLKEIFLT